MAKPGEHTGKRVGKLTYLRNTWQKAKTHHYIWEAVCDCGSYAYVPTCNISQNQSCGCMQFGNAGYEPVEVYSYTYRPIKHRHKTKYTGQVIPYANYRLMAAADCAYCGAEPSNLFGKPPNQRPYQGIDRIDNTKGYTLENCAPCCDDCNSMKGDRSLVRFLDQARRIVSFMDNQ